MVRALKAGGRGEWQFRGVVCGIPWAVRAGAPVRRAGPALAGLTKLLRCTNLNRMVEHREAELDHVYGAISHPVRRSLLEQLTVDRARVTDLAGHFNVSLAAVSKHIRVLEDAGLVRRSITGRDNWLALDASRLEPASRWLDTYRRFWEAGLDRLEAQLKEPR
jgi:DNA-binding transcriptional ArsR family regulator